jgi:hypothetical protein
MMDPRLQIRLAPFARMLRQARLSRDLAVCWGVAAIVGVALFLLQVLVGRIFHYPIWIIPLAVGVVMAGMVFLRESKRTDDVLEVIRAIEPGQPDVRHLLSAAAEQKPVAGSGSFTFLQFRVIHEALTHPRHAVWLQQLRRRLARAHTAQAGALLAMAAVIILLRLGSAHGAAIFGPLIAEGITVTPGDTQVERGTGLVIAARFGGAPPAEATLVLNSADGKESRIPMARRLADPVFGASVPEISEAGVYHIEYRGKKSRDYKIAVFEYPALVRADATLSYPAYTGLANRTILDTLRVSAVEGSHLHYSLKLNKAVALARLEGTNQSLSLLAESNAVVALPDLLLTSNMSYTLELVDAEGRSNKFPAEFVFQALPNQRPNVKLVFPRGDTRVSRLEELQLQAEASDDFGLLKYGIGFGIAGQEQKLVELGQTAPANTIRKFNYLIPLETLNVGVDQAVAYFAWADDYGPDGRPRRTYGDMFFAEVRPFDEIFRPDQSGSGEGEGQQGGGNERARLAELQKQIVVATWNLEREKPGAGGALHP